MKKKLILLFTFLSFLAFSQSKKENPTLGYYCGYSGSATQVVKKISDLIYKKDYKTIKSLLYSKIPAENFLAVVLCRRFAYQKIITLSETDSKRITELFKSKEKIPLCGGCTEHDEVELSKMLSEQQNITNAVEYFFGEN